MRPATSTSAVRSSDIAELEFELSDPTYFFVGLSHDHACRVRLEKKIRLSDGTLVEFFIARDCTPAAIRERADRTAMVDDVRIIAEGGHGILFRASLSGRCVADTIEGTGAIPGSITAADGVGQVIAQVPGDVDSTDVVASVLDRHPTSKLMARRCRDVSTPVFTPWGVRQVMRERLTDRQWEVLQTAYRNGYFRRPREHTGEEVAEMLDISSATFSQHLRSALRNLLSTTVEDGSTAER